MRYDRDTIIDRAIGVLDEHGLADLTMRRLGRELGVQASAIYHHFENKQALLAAVADELLKREIVPVDTYLAWDERLLATCQMLHRAMLACRNGAEVIATVYSFGLGAAEPVRLLRTILDDAGFDSSTVRSATDTLLHYLFGYTVDEQTVATAQSLGVAVGTRQRGDFTDGLRIVVAGLAARRS